MNIFTIPKSVRKQRGKRSLRAIAKDVGMSAATISRIENGNTRTLLAMDVHKFSVLCDWLGYDLKLTRKAKRKKQTP